MKKNKQSSFILFFLISLLFLYLLHSGYITKQILIYTKLFIEKLFPASFLFFTFSSLLISYQIIAKLDAILPFSSARFYVIFMSLISGFPSGSKYIVDLYHHNYLSIEDANYLIRFTHFPNPVFILGPVMVLFPSGKYVITILFSLIISNFLIGLIYYKKSNSSYHPSSSDASNFSFLLTRSVLQSMKTILLIYGTSLFFYLVVRMICYYIPFSPFYYVLINGFFDLTNGTFLTSILSSPVLRGVVLLFFFAFGGISIHMQVKSIISDTSILYKNFFWSRVLQTIFSILIFLLIIYW